jgi:hypothetical protein
LIKEERRMKEERYKIYKDEIAGDFMVVQTAKKPWKCFVMFDADGEPLFSTDMNEGMRFMFKGMADHIADGLGKDWCTVDVSQKAIQDAEKLLRAIFGERKEE